MYDEQFILPFSHDEVVHGKKSLMHKMTGDRYNQFANLRVMFIWLITHPGKKLLFMGGEWGQFLEWRDYTQLEWVDLEDPLNAGMQNFTRTLNKLYAKTPSLWAQDHDPDGMQVTIGNGPEQLSYIRWGQAPEDCTVVVLNLMPVEVQNFRVPVPAAGVYTVVLNTESQHFGGTWRRLQRTLKTTGIPAQGQPDSVEVVLPAMGALLIQPK
jgi:1,4-alpha-glucan branching enzyme